VLQAVSRSLHVKRNVEFIFSGIGCLSIRDARVKMKFYKEFVKSMDHTGELVNALRNVSIKLAVRSFSRYFQVPYVQRTAFNFLLSETGHHRLRVFRDYYFQTKYRKHGRSAEVIEMVPSCYYLINKQQKFYSLSERYNKVQRRATLLAATC
jgi:hypothetical protein